MTFYASWYKYLVKSSLDALVVVYSIAYVALRCYLLDADICSVLSVGLYARSLFLKMAAWELNICRLISMCHRHCLSAVADPEVRMRDASATGIQQFFAREKYRQSLTMLGICYNQKRLFWPTFGDRLFTQIPQLYLREATSWQRRTGKGGQKKGDGSATVCLSVVSSVAVILSRHSSRYNLATSPILLTHRDQKVPSLFEWYVCHKSKTRVHGRCARLVIMI